MGYQAHKFDEMLSYRAWQLAMTGKYRAEYAPYDVRPEFDEGMVAYQHGVYWCPYDTASEPGYKAKAWDQGFECQLRLQLALRGRPVPVFGRG
jgi:hypothetical protein